MLMASMQFIWQGIRIHLSLELLFVRLMKEKKEKSPKFSLNRVSFAHFHVLI